MNTKFKRMVISRAEVLYELPLDNAIRLLYEWTKTDVITFKEFKELFNHIKGRLE